MAEVEEAKTMTETESQITPIVLPAVSAVEAKRAWEAYQELKNQIITKDDVRMIQNRKFLCKSYWRKLATFFNLSVDVVDEKKEVTEYNTTFHFICKAIAPNGRYAIGSGSCDLLEKGRKNTIHNARATAETRAWNRAVSNLVGGGEVSAEEANSSPQTYDVSTGKYDTAATESQKALIMKMTGEKADEEAELRVNEFLEDMGAKPTFKWDTVTKKQASWLVDKMIKSKKKPEKPEEIPEGAEEIVKANELPL